MSGLPKGWAIHSLGELCELENGDRGKNYPSRSVLVEKGVPFINAGHLNSGRVDMSEMNFIPEDRFESLRSGKIRKGDLLFCLRGSLGKSALITNLDRGAVASSLVIVRPRGAVTSAFMSHYFDTPIAKQMISIYDNGSAQPNLSGADLKKFEVPLPPLPEQRRIVARIEELFSRLDAGVAALRHAKAQLQRYRQSVLAAAVTGELTKKWREQNPDTEPASELLERILIQRREQWNGRGKYKEATQPEIKNTPKLPSKWIWASWEAVLTGQEGGFKRGPFGSALKKSIFVNRGYKVYEQYCPINDDCSFVRYYITPKKFEELKSFEVRAGDYLISCSGVTLGRITRVPDEFEEGVINQALLRVRINENVICHRYFLFLFRSPFFQRQIFANTAGVAIPNVKGVKDLKRLPIPLPHIAEQHQIVAEIEARATTIDHLEAELDRQFARSERLRQSSLSHAFSGKL